MLQLVQIVRRSIFENVAVQPKAPARSAKSNALSRDELTALFARELGQGRA